MIGTIDTVATIGTVGWIDDIARSLREAFFMFWETLWPLVLGFGLSGAVQAFVSRESLQTKLGDHRPAAVARASGYGMASSSCSYAAAAMAKSLFARGADFVTGTVFMFASTNLVVELGIVLVVLIGWQFAVGEFVGGAIMIVLLALGGGWWFHRRSVDQAREHLAAEAASEPPARLGPNRGRAAACAVGPETAVEGGLGGRRHLHDGRPHHASAGTVGRLHDGRLLDRARPRPRLARVFLHGHGTWTTIENALVGPFVAIISFVCSIGNVPLAAALWQGGISFGGVISFIFADLITFPLLLVYRRYYGNRMAVRMLVGFWAIMSCAGLATEAIFRAAGLVPTVRPVQVAPAHFAWDYTTYLNIVFLVVFAALYLTYRNRDRWGAAKARRGTRSAA